MPFPIPDVYTSEAADIERDESKRRDSPPSFFFAQAWGAVLAANYFRDDRLSGRSGVAVKHRHRIQYAAFGQVMAAFEWCVKDFVAQIIDSTDLLDEKVEAAKWIELKKSRVLAVRQASASAGAMLIHPTQGWHEAKTLNSRYTELLEYAPLLDEDKVTLDRLWLLRHSVAHNAGFVTNHDAFRMRAPSLSEKPVKVDADFLEATWGFLSDVVRRFEDPLGTKVISRWCKEKATGDFDQDGVIFMKLKHIVTAVESRSKPLPEVTQADYEAAMQST
jgi:hypothetical protein